MGIFDIFKRKQMDIQTEIPQQQNSSTSVKPAVSVQNTIPAEITNNFVMQVEDVFTITGRGTVVTGRVLRGRVDLNDNLIIRETGMSVIVSGIEQFRKILDYAQEGDNVGILIKDLPRNQISSGMYLVK